MVSNSTPINIFSQPEKTQLSMNGIANLRIINFSNDPSLFKQCFVLYVTGGGRGVGALRVKCLFGFQIGSNNGNQTRMVQVLTSSIIL